MTIQEYRDELKLKLSGYVLDLELTDSTLDLIINSALREVQRYYCSTRLATIPYANVIDLKDCAINSVSRVFRTEGYMATSPGQTGIADPMYMAQWQMLSNAGNTYALTDWALNYGAWNTMLQIRNTTSTDLIFRYDQYEKKLYINIAYEKPDNITIEYVPLLTSVEEIKSSYWIDILMQLSVALTKLTLGTVRGRYTQSNALWQQDSQQMRDEGNQELKDIRDYLKANTNLAYPID